MKCPKCGSEMKLEYQNVYSCSCIIYTMSSDDIEKEYKGIQQRLDKVLSKFDKVNNNIWFNGVCVEYINGSFILDQDNEIQLDTVELLIRDYRMER